MHCVTEVAQVKHLMGGKDAADVAAWAHKASIRFVDRCRFRFLRFSQISTGEQEVPLDH